MPITLPPFRSRLHDYQLMFAIITPALSPRVRGTHEISAMAVHILWSILVYDPMAHGLGQRRTAECRPGGRFLHSISPVEPWAHHLGSFGLGLRSLLGTSRRYPKEPMPPHSVVLSFHRACMLWWDGSDSTRAARWLLTVWQPAIRGYAFRAAAAVLGWGRGVATQWQASALGAISGAVAG